MHYCIYFLAIYINIALVTKAEFDSALADFNARLTTFEAGINSKIDSQVTSYLDRNGIWNGAAQYTLLDAIKDQKSKSSTGFLEDNHIIVGYPLMVPAPSWSGTPTSDQKRVINSYVNNDFITRNSISDNAFLKSLTMEPLELVSVGGRMDDLSHTDSTYCYFFGVPWIRKITKSGLLFGRFQLNEFHKGTLTNGTFTNSNSPNSRTAPTWPVPAFTSANTDGTGTYQVRHISLWFYYNGDDLNWFGDHDGGPTTNVVLGTSSWAHIYSTKSYIDVQVFVEQGRCLMMGWKCDNNMYAKFQEYETRAHALDIQTNKGSNGVGWYHEWVVY